MQKNITKNDDVNSKINTTSFRTILVPTFNKIVVERGEAFHIRPDFNSEDFDALFNNIYHGIIYNFFLQLEEKEILSYEEYTYLYEHYLQILIFDGVKTVIYGESTILTASSFSKKSGSYITPLYKRDTLRIHNKITKELMAEERELKKIRQREQLKRDKEEEKKFKECLDSYSK